MKFVASSVCELGLLSRPARGAWIEIMRSANISQKSASRPARGAWIEMSLPGVSFASMMSRPPRGAWIEIMSLTDGGIQPTVAPPTGRVD